MHLDVGVREVAVGEVCHGVGLCAFGDLCSVPVICDPCISSTRDLSCERRGMT